MKHIIFLLLLILSVFSFAAIEDGKDNIRYLVVDMTYPDYSDLITAFTTIHTNKESGNILTVIPNIANTQSIVKVVGHVGWLEDEESRLSDGLSSGLIYNVYTYSELSNVHDLLISEDYFVGE